MKLHATATKYLKVFSLVLAAAFMSSTVSSSLDDVTYTYDDKGRLKTVFYTASSKKITYIYDDAGNRTSVVIAVNSAPTAVDDTVGGGIVYEDVAIYVLSNDTDPDSDPLSITSVSGAGSGCYVEDMGTYITIMRTSKGSCTATYYISDGNGGTDSATATSVVISY